MYFLGFTKLLVALGYGLNDVEIIDLETSSTTCTRIEDFPDKVYGAVGILGPNLQPLICGGYSSGGGDENKCFTLENGNWQLFSLMNQKRRQAAIAPSPFLSNDISVMVSGGTNGSSNLDTTEIWKQNAWHLTSMKMPVEVRVQCMVQINVTTVMMIGGLNSTFLGETFLLNSETEKWVNGPHLLEARGWHSCARIKASKTQPYFSIIAVGGYNGTFKNSVEILDEVSGNWRYGPPLPIPLAAGALVEDAAGGVILVGGETLEVTNHDTLFRLSHAGPDAMWFKMPQKLQNARRYHVSFLVPEEITNCTLD